ncbi:TIGR04086 family membrane protein [Zhaonella formicivorans]|uniref:TIGR04086 family membrane protein n=1 Tax=Zhaonella formicivorans TaxID=2528593 RepID=UPI0010ECA35A|nr:TIGR04086 family membrane protein [Zhaonella formicivorans]
MQKAGKDHNSLLTPLFNGFLNAIVLSIILVILFSLIFQFSSLSEYHLKSFSQIVLVLSVFWGGFKSARLAESRALFYSFGVGVLYLLTAILLAVLIAEPLSMATVGIKMLYCMSAGVIGGIVGVSFK